MSVDRSAFDEAITNMAVKSSPFYKEYVFYLHLLSQCKVVFSETLPAAAGVSFDKTHYTLHLSSRELIGMTEDKKGNPIEVLGFTSKLPLEQRIGILKHEMLHIILGHLFRVEDRDFGMYNIASDCALDQEINPKHLPEYAIYPSNFPSKNPVPLKQTAETYYDLLEKEAKAQKQCDKPGNGGEGKTGKPVLKGVGDHEVWKQSDGDPELQKELTKNMVEKAADQTVKAVGTLPSNYSQILENLTIKREVDWERVLRQIVGNKKANVRKTLMRRDRRLPFASWIKGKTKDRVFQLGVISDVSGSVSDEALYGLWGEIVNICTMFNTDVNMIQIDTKPHEPEKLTKTTKMVERKACGGTHLSGAINKFAETNVYYDALVVTTDGYLTKDDVEAFGNLHKPVIWLIEAKGSVMPEMNTGKMRAIKLKENK